MNRRPRVYLVNQSNLRRINLKVATQNEKVTKLKSKLCHPPKKTVTTLIWLLSFCTFKPLIIANQQGQNGLMKPQ